MAGTSWGNRRRRWWLRAQSELSGMSTVADDSSWMASRADRYDDPAAACSPPLPAPATLAAIKTLTGVPEYGCLTLKEPDSGQSIRVPLTTPFLFVGRESGCGLQLQDPAIAPRECVLVWCQGTLFEISLATASPQIRPWTAGSTQTWGRWTSELQNVDQPTHATDEKTGLSVAIHWSHSAALRPTTLPMGLSLIGTDRRCHIVLNEDSLQPLQALLVHTLSGVWVLDLAAQPSLHVHGRPQLAAPLESGDRLRLGDLEGTVAVQWTNAGSSAPSSRVPAADLTPADDPWRTYLQRQRDRLLELQQLLEGGLRLPEAERPRWWTDFRRRVVDLHGDRPRRTAPVAEAPTSEAPISATPSQASE